MAAPNRQTAQGPQKYPFSFRTGEQGFMWRGMVPDGDAGSVPPNRPRLIINATLRSGQWLTRGGQRPINTTALHASDACVTNLFDFPLATPRQLVVLGDGCPDISSSVGFCASLYDHEQSPIYQPGVYYDAGTVGLAAAVYNGELYFGQDLSLRRLVSLRPPYGTKLLAVSGHGQDTLIETFPSGNSLSALIAFDGKLFIGLDNDASSEIYYFDGVTLYDDAPITNNVQRFATFRDKLIVGFDGSPNSMLVRGIGGSPGTFTTVTPPAGTLNFFRAASYKDTLYITVNDDYIYSFDGTTLTQITTATTGIPANANIFGVAEAFGSLYLAYEDVTASAGKLASFDGTTWTATAKNFTTQISTIRQALDLILYRGNLVVAIKNSTNTYYLLQSPGATVSGTWTQITQSQLTSGPINELLVF